MPPCEFTGDDDFLRGMIPPYQGAIDMARIMLQSGQGPEVHGLAEDMIEATEDKMKIMRN